MGRPVPGSATAACTRCMAVVNCSTPLPGLDSALSAWQELHATGTTLASTARLVPARSSCLRRMLSLVSFKGLALFAHPAAGMAAGALLEA